MATGNFGKLTENLARGNIDFDTHSFKGLLVTSDLTESNLDTWEDRADVNNEVAAGGGYSTGGVAVTVTVGTYDTTNNRTSITFTNLSPGWTTATISARGIIIYRDTGSAATDYLVSYMDFGSTVSSTSGNFSVTFSTPLYINR